MPMPAAGLVDLQRPGSEATAVGVSATVFTPLLILPELSAMSPAALWSVESFSSSMQGSTLHEVITTYIYMHICMHMYTYTYENCAWDLLVPRPVGTKGSRQGS